MLSDAPSDLVTLCRAYLTVMNPAHAFSHRTAAQLYGLPLPRYADIPSLLEVSAPRPLRRPRGAGILGHDIGPEVWEAGDLTLQDHPRGELIILPTLSPELVWVQLAATLDHRDLVALGDAIVTVQHPSVEAFGTLSTAMKLNDAATRWAGRRGAVAAARAIQHVRVGPLSRPESLLRLMMVEARLPHPEINIHIDDDRGAQIAMVDIAWPAWRTIVEYEGDGHRTSVGKFRSDIDRFGRLADANWAAHRAHAGHVFGDPNELLARIANSLESHGWRRPRRGLRPVAPARV